MNKLERNSIDLSREIGISIRLKKLDIDIVRDFSRYGYSDQEILD